MKTNCPLPKGFSGTRRVSGCLVILMTLSLIAASTAIAAPFAYVSNFNSASVSVIDAGATAVCAVAGQTPPCVVATVPVGSSTGSAPGGVAVNPAGTFAYVANQGEGTVSVIRTSDNTVVGGPLPVGFQPWGVAVTADNSTVYVGLGDGGVAVIDTTNGNAVSTISGVGGVLNGILAVGSRVFVSDATNGQVVALQNGGVVQRINVGTPPNSLPMGLVANLTGTRVYVVDLSIDSMLLTTALEVSVIDATSNPMRVAQTITLDPDSTATPGGIALSPDGTKLYTPSDVLDTLHVVTLANGSVASVRVGDSPMGVATDPDGRVYVANALAGTVTVFDPTFSPHTVRVGSTPFVFGAFTTAGPPPPPPPAQFVLSLSTVGQGSITANPQTVSGTYAAGTVVGLSATPAANYQFSGWSGACAGTGGCSVTMNAATSVTATFTLKQFALTLATVGNGTITASPQPVAGTYAAGTVVSLTATPAAGSQFSGWSGACSGTGGCSVTMNAATSVTATFAALPPPPSQQFTLTLSTVGSGSIGAMPSSVGGRYNAGTIVGLTAKPGAGFKFHTWSGACRGANASCNVTMNTARNATATFVTAPMSCDDKIKDLQGKVATFKTPWWHDHQLKVTLKMYADSLAELNRAKAKVGNNKDKRIVHAQTEFDNGKNGLCLGHYWRADHEFWETYVIAREILKPSRR